MGVCAGGRRKKEEAEELKSEKVGLVARPLPCVVGCAGTRAEEKGRA